MNNTLIKTLALLLISLLSFKADAQNRGNSKQNVSIEERVEKKVQKMKNDLNLSQDQYEKIYALQLEALKNKQNRKAQIKSERKENARMIENEMKSILSEDQYAKFKENRKENYKKLRKKRHNNHGDTPENYRDQ